MEGCFWPYTLINPEVDLSYSVVDRFVRYVKVFTQSASDSSTHPSTARQFDLARVLVDELKEIGLVDVYVDDYCYVYGTLPANTDATAPVIGFIAHMDTSPDL